MAGYIRGSGLAVIAVMTLVLGGPAAAQENFDSGKNGAQLFASDCGICHKSPIGLAKAGGIFGLTGFLREHYTASRESAGAIAAYLQSVDSEQAPAKSKRSAKRTAKGDEKSKTEGTKPKSKAGDAKTGDTKSDVGKPGVGKPGDGKPGESKEGASAKPATAKTSEPKASEKKTSDTKSSDAKSSEPKNSAPKSSEAKSSEAKPSEAKPSEAKTKLNAAKPKPDGTPAAKPDKSN